MENENKDLNNDLIKLISIVIYKFDKKQKNFNIDYIQSLNFIKDFLSLVINLHIIYIESKQFSKIYFEYFFVKEGLKHKKLIIPEYIDLFKIQLFTENIFPIMYHTYLIKEERKENIEIIDEIHDNIFEIIIQIYLNGIESEYGLSDFLYLLDKFNWYIYEQKKKLIKENKEEIQKFKLFIFFSLIV